MKSNKIAKEARYKRVIDERTGVMTKLYGWQPAHTEFEFFTMYLRPWLGLKDDDVSRKIKVFVYCILVSNVSNGKTDETDGNYFHTSDVISKYIKENFKSDPEDADADVVKRRKAMENYVRVYLSKLVKDEFIVKDEETRGRYHINPKFGIKGGAVTEETYKKLVVVKEPAGNKGIKPNTAFEDGGAE